MRLIAIILNYNTADLTLKAMDSAVDALSVIEGGWKLLVVDNCSTDDSGKIISDRIELNHTANKKDWCNVEYVQSLVNGGFGAGNNIGFRRYLDTEHEPEYFYVLNSDAFPQKEAIKSLLKVLDSSADCGMAGSYIYGVDDTPHATAFRFPSISSEFENAIRLGIITKLLNNRVISLGIPEKTRKVDWLAGASILIRSSVLKKAGLFDEAFFLYFEETDLCRRAKNLGWDTVYVKESKVAHVGSASTGMKTATRIPQFWLDSRKHYFQKNHGTVYFLATTLARLVGESLYRVRVIIEGKQEVSPKYFIRDMLRHTFSSKTLPVVDQIKNHE